MSVQSVESASTWRVVKAETNGWETGYCWIPQQEWLRIWIRKGGRAHTAHVGAGGRISFGASPWTIEALLTWVEAYRDRAKYDPRLSPTAEPSSSESVTDSEVKPAL